MSSEKKEEKGFELTPEQGKKVNEILKVFGEMLQRHAKESRKSKAKGGFVDKEIYQARPDDVIGVMQNVRRRLLDEGGFLDNFPGPDDPIGQTKYFISVLSPPSNEMEAYYLEQLERDLARLQKTRAK